MHVRVRLAGQPDKIVVVDSKLTKIDQFRRLVREKFNVEPKLQRLFYGGKVLEDGYSFHDYNIKLNDVIQLMIRSTSPFEEDNKAKDNEKNDTIKKIEYEDAESKLYEIGDLVDMRDKEEGVWFEGKIIRIVKDPDFKTDVNVDTSKIISNTDKDENNEESPHKSPKKQNSDSHNQSQFDDTELDTDVGLLYQVHLVYDADDADTEYICKLNEIRPRARKTIEITDLKIGQKVMINHNPETPSEKGYWYDFTVSEVKKIARYDRYEIIGTLFLGPESVPQDDTKIRIHDKIYEIEEVVPISKRSEEYKKLMVTPTVTRALPLNCLTCRDDEDSPCKDCGCYLCRGKELPDKIMLCDECNRGYHLYCLTPPLTEIPDEDWYCPSCKLDPNLVVAPGAAKQTKKANQSKSKRDWGRGMACAGKTQTCAMPPNHFGPIPGIDVGMIWRFRIQLSESGVHRPPVSGIHGRDVEGAYSLVLSGGYEDDVDNGIEFTYTGSGGRDLSGNKRTADQSSDQTLTRENKALARNCAVKEISEDGADAGDNWKQGKPVRVVRSYKMLKHFPQYAPQEGIRYDGIYKVVKYYPETGKSGYRVWKYLLRRDDPNPAPWDKGAKKYSIVYPEGYLEAEAEKKAKKGKELPKNTKMTKKRALRESNHISNDDIFNKDSPPQKRQKQVFMQSPQEKSKSGRASRGKKIADSPPKVANPFEAAKKGKSPKVSKSPKKENLEKFLTEDEFAAVKEDKLNAKLWDECLNASKGSGKQQFINHVTQLFLCIICQEVAANPVTTKCHHNFCLSCLKLAFKSTGVQNCSYCRQDLSKDELEVNECLKTALQTVMPGYDNGKK